MTKLERITVRIPTAHRKAIRAEVKRRGKANQVANESMVVREALTMMFPEVK